ncbi:MAG TPA: hypothetical protein EYP19_17060 [Desulfobacterales bacterium]|nr:hypothetical protein [Desulfobacterales bacterium]
MIDSGGNTGKNVCATLDNVTQTFLSVEEKNTGKKCLCHTGMETRKKCLCDTGMETRKNACAPGGLATGRANSDHFPLRLRGYIKILKGPVTS